MTHLYLFIFKKHVFCCYTLEFQEENSHCIFFFVTRVKKKNQSFDATRKNFVIPKRGEGKITLPQVFKCSFISPPPPLPVLWNGYEHEYTVEAAACVRVCACVCVCVCVRVCVT